MDDGVYVIPHKRTKSDVDFSQCVICQEKKDDQLRKDVQDSSIEKVIQAAVDRHKYGDNEQKYRTCIQILKEQSVSELKQRCVTWHANCYKFFIMKTNIARLKNKAEQSIEENSINTTVYSTPGRPKPGPSSTSHDNEGKRVLRSVETPCKKELCIICHTNTNLELHTAQKLELGKKLLKLAESYPDSGGFLRRMNTIPNAEDAVANDVKYHRGCFISALRKNADKTQSKSKTYTRARIISDIEIVGIVKENLIHRQEHVVMTTNTIDANYKKLLMKNGLTKDDLSPNYKKNPEDIDLSEHC